MKLICYYPPVYKSFVNGTSKAVKITEQLCKENDIEIYNALQDSAFMADSTLFYDNDHLNINGAKIFTRDLSLFLKNVIAE